MYSRIRRTGIRRRHIKLFELFLRTGSAVDCVVCNNDAMALGVVEACKRTASQYQYSAWTPRRTAAEAIRNGDMAFTVYQSGSGQGHTAVDAAVQLTGDGDVKELEGSSKDGKYVWVDFERVDSSNVSQYGK